MELTTVFRRAILALIVISGWALMTVLFAAYFGADLSTISPLAEKTQIWLLLLVIMLSRSVRLRRSHVELLRWLSTTTLGSRLCAKAAVGSRLVRSALRSAYINIYLLGDVLFCVGTPLLIVSASAGWWLIDEVSYVGFLIYCCIISTIFFAGLYSNVVRLLALGYFFGYWLLSADMMMYPFIAPAVVQDTISNMTTEALSALLPALGLVLIVYLLVRRHGLRVISEPVHFSRAIFSNYLLLGCLLMAIPLLAIVADMMVGHINVHMLFIGVGIALLDGYWQDTADREPALSSDWRYFKKLSWQH